MKNEMLCVYAEAMTNPSNDNFSQTNIPDGHGKPETTMRMLTNENSKRVEERDRE